MDRRVHPRLSAMKITPRTHKRNADEILFLNPTTAHSGALIDEAGNIQEVVTLCRRCIDVSLIQYVLISSRVFFQFLLSLFLVFSLSNLFKTRNLMRNGNSHSRSDKWWFVLLLERCKIFSTYFHTLQYIVSCYFSWIICKLKTADGRNIMVFKRLVSWNEKCIRG